MDRLVFVGAASLICLPTHSCLCILAVGVCTGRTHATVCVQLALPDATLSVSHVHPAASTSKCLDTITRTQQLAGSFFQP